jgi:hypothetical protein
LHLNGEFPAELANTVTAIAFRDDPDVAGAALLALGGSDEPDKIPDEVILLELLAPLKVHFDRTREAFRTWMARDNVAEQVVKKSKEYIRDLLVTRAYWCSCAIWAIGSSLPRPFSLGGVVGRVDQWVKWSFDPSEAIATQFEIEMDQSGPWRRVVRTSDGPVGRSRGALLRRAWPTAGLTGRQRLS